MTAMPRDLTCDFSGGLVSQARGRLLVALGDLAAAQATTAERSDPPGLVATEAVAGLAAAIRDKDEFVSSMLCWVICSTYSTRWVWTGRKFGSGANASIARKCSATCEEPLIGGVC